MTKKKVCKNCKLFVEGAQCPHCKGTEFTQSFQGRISIIDAARSTISKKMNITQKGEYAIKIR